MRVVLRQSRYNRGSLAAVWAVLEAECATADLEIVCLRSPQEIRTGDLVLFSFMSAQAPEVGAELAQLRRRLGCQFTTLAGGAHPCSSPEGTLALGFDWVYTGEAGPSLAELVDRMAAGEELKVGVLDARDRPGLDRYPPWPRSGGLFCALELTRGCPWHCAFCQTPALHGRRPRHRSVPAMVRAAEHAVATGHTFTRFISPNAFAYGSADGIGPDPAALEELLAALRKTDLQKIYLGSFPSEVRPESVTAEMVGLVTRYCDNRDLVVGIQSGSDAMLRYLRRGHDVACALRAVDTIGAAGLRPRVDFIFGLPDESAADQAATRGLLRELVDHSQAHIDIHLFSPLPGTALADTRPGMIDPATRELLDELIGAGRASGLRPFAEPRGAPPGA